MKAGHSVELLKSKAVDRFPVAMHSVMVCEMSKGGVRHRTRR